MRQQKSQSVPYWIPRALAVTLVLLPLAACSTMESIWDTVAFWRDDPMPNPSAKSMNGSSGTSEPGPIKVATGAQSGPTDMAQIKSELARLDAERQWVEARIKELKSQLPANVAASAADPMVKSAAPGSQTAPTKAASPPMASQPAASADVFADTASFGVHLASYRKIADAARGWAQLQKSMPDMLGNMQAHVITVDFNDGRGAFIRLMAGPLANKDLAAKKCADLKAKGQYCKVDSFAGEILKAG